MSIISVWSLGPSVVMYCPYVVMRVICGYEGHTCTCRLSCGSCGLSDLWSCESSVVIMVMCGHEGEGYDIC